MTLRRPARLLAPTLIRLTLLLTLMAGSALAQDEGDSPVPKKPDAVYVPMDPPFVINYGGEGRLRYMKVALTLRVESPDDADAVRHHMPYLRNEIVLLFSAQNEPDIATTEAKEQLRRAALDRIRTVIEEEDGKHGVTDLYFDQFIIQR